MTDQSPPQTDNVGKKSKKWLWITLAVILLAGNGGGIWYFLHQNKTPKETEATHEEAEATHAPGQPIFIELAPFTVNLPPDGQFLQATFHLQFADQEDLERLTLYLPQVRSRLLMMLSNKSATTLSSLEGKTDLTKEITALLQQPFEKGLPAIKLVNVLITSFIIQ